MSVQAVERPIEINFKPSESTASRIVTAALWLPGTAAIISIVVVIVLAIQRIPYPYELDWLETGMLEHVRRVLHGQPLYTQPSVSFTQMPYAPFSFVVGAAFSSVFGVHLWVMRAISFGSTIGVFALIFWFVKKETTSNLASLIAIGVYAGTYKLSGTWFDIGKSDDLFMFIMLGSLAVARVAQTRKMAILSGFLMALAVMTKQTAIFAFVPVAAYLIATRRRAGIYFTISGLAFGAGTTLILNITSHGWFDYFVWELLFQHPLVGQSKLRFIKDDMAPFWPVLIVVALALPRLLQRNRLWTTGFYAFVFAGLIAGSWSSRLHSGGAFNVLMPAFAALAIALGIALGTLLLRPPATALVLLSVAACLMQFAFLRYDPGAQVPSASDHATGDAFISWLRTINGPVFVYAHPTYAVMAGHPSFATEGGTEDVLRGKTLRAKADFERSMADAVHEQKFAAIVVDGPDDYKGFPADLTSYYRKLPGTAVPNATAFRPIDLLTGHPNDVWVPIGSNNVVMPPQ